LQARLDLPGRTRVEHTSEVRSEGNAAGRTDKIEKVKDVEDLRAKLETSSFLELKMLHDGHVDVSFAILINNIASCVSKCEWSRHRKRVGIEPALGSASAL